MRVYKRSKTSRNYQVAFRDTDNIARRLSLFTDKTASEEAGRKIEKLVALRMAGEKPDIALLKWLDTCPARILRNLSEWHVVDERYAVAATAIEDQVKGWQDYMETSGFAPRYISNVVNIVKRCIAWCEWGTTADISKDSLVDYLKSLSAKGRSLDTLNHQVRAVKAFCNWMVAEKRLTENPISRFPMYNPDTDRRHKRRALTADEIQRLLAAASTGVFTKGLTGHERYLIYRLAIETGLRWSEIRSLCIASFMLPGESPTVTIEAKHAKNRKRETQALSQELAGQISEHFAQRMDKELAFPGMSITKAAAMIRHDLKRAGITYKDGLGRAADFHALRHTFGTLLCRAGIPLATAQRLMRHSDPKLTSNIYNHVEDSDKTEAIKKISEITGHNFTNMEKVEPESPINVTENDMPDAANVVRKELKNQLTIDRHVRKSVRNRRDQSRKFGTYRGTEMRTTHKKSPESLISDAQEKTHIPNEDMGLNNWHPGRESNPYLQLRRLSREYCICRQSQWLQAS